MKNKIALIIMSIAGLLVLASCGQEYYNSDVVEFDLKQTFYHLDDYEDENLTILAMTLLEEHVIFYKDRDKNPLEVTLCNSEKTDILKYIETSFTTLTNNEKEEQLAYFLPSGELIELDYSGGSCFFTIGSNLNVINDEGSFITLHPKVIDEESKYYNDQNLPKTAEEIKNFYEEYSETEVISVPGIQSEADEVPVDSIGYIFTYLGKTFTIVISDANSPDTLTYEIIKHKD